MVIGHWSFLICHFRLAGALSRSKPHRSKGLTVKESEEENSQLLADQLEDRLINFAVRIIKLSANLPKTPAGKHISGQILRCGTSPAPNYGEARGAESRADFIHKIRVVLKELNETSIWLKMIERGELLKTSQLEDLTTENSELCKIFVKSLKTARDRASKKMTNEKSAMTNDQ